LHTTLKQSEEDTMSESTGPVNIGPELTGHIRRTLDRQLRKYLIGRTLGFCPRTGETIDVRTAVFVYGPDETPYMALSQRGWAEVVRQGDVQNLRDAGYAPDPESIKDPAIRALSVPPAAPEAPAQDETLF